MKLCCNFHNQKEINRWKTWQVVCCVANGTNTCICTDVYMYVWGKTNKTLQRDFFNRSWEMMVVKAFHHCTKYNLQCADQKFRIKMLCVASADGKRQKFSFHTLLVNFQRKLQFWCQTEALWSDTVLHQFDLRYCLTNLSYSHKKYSKRTHTHTHTLVFKYVSRKTDVQTCCLGSGGRPRAGGRAGDA